MTGATTAVEDGNRYLNPTNRPFVADPNDGNAFSGQTLSPVGCRLYALTRKMYA